MWTRDHAVCDSGAGGSGRLDGWVALFQLMLSRGEVEDGGDPCRMVGCLGHGYGVISARLPTGTTIDRSRSVHLIYKNIAKIYKHSPAGDFYCCERLIMGYWGVHYEV